MATSFTRMDEGTPEQWAVIHAEGPKHQGRHYYEILGRDPNMRDNYVGEPWYELCARFADEWDQTSFDPDYDTLPLEHFEPLVKRMTVEFKL